MKESQSRAKDSAKKKPTALSGKRSRSRAPKKTNANRTNAPILITQNRKPTLTLPPAPAQDLTPLLPLVSDRSVNGPPPPFVGGHTPLSAALRFIEPSWRNYIMYVDMEARAGNADARRYLAIWQSLPPSERRSHLPEQMCELASVSAPDLLSWITRQVWIEGSAKASMCLSFMRDKVLEQTAQFAMQSPDNYKHADMFLKASGLLPTTQSSNGRVAPVNVFNMPVASSGAVALAGSHSESSPVSSSGLRDMDHEIVELSKIMQQQNSAIDCRAEALHNDADDDDDDEDDDDEDK